MNELQALHDAITQTFKAGLPAGVRVDAFPDLEDGFDLPAVFFGMTGFSPGEDTGTGMTAIKGQFQAVILVDPILPKASLQAMWLGMQMASILRYQFWGLDFVEATLDVAGEPDNTNPALASFEVWGVRWTQIFHVGEMEEWPFPEIVPTPVSTELAPAEVEERVPVL